MIENSSGVCTSPSAAENNLKEEILKLKKENLLLQQEAEVGFKCLSFLDRVTHGHYRKGCSSVMFFLDCVGAVIP